MGLLKKQLHPAYAHRPRNSFVLKQLLLEHKAEVKGMILTEYNEEEIMNGFKEEAMEEGIKKGMISTLTALVADNLLSIHEASKRANVSEDEFVKLMRVYQTHA